MSVTPMQPPIPKLKKEAIVSALKKGNRVDGRSFEDFRSITIELNPIPKRSNGSALVKLGNTSVLVGVKIGVERPFPDRPNEGVLQVHAEFVPLASPSFEPGPPDENAVEVARVIDRCLRESKSIDLGELVIVPGKYSWSIYNDIYLLDHDGNVTDASTLASMAALNVAKLPKLVSVENDQVRIDYSTMDKPLPVKLNVVTVTVVKIGGYILVDPNLDEEILAEAKAAIGIDSNGRIVGIQKSGGGLSVSEVRYAVDIAIKKGRELLTLLEKTLKTV
ncbi:MAG: exosome complex protein Rrp42 [Sulfolobales archaeon]|nr:exosome complex protein Rrp42 [Sulfolobales archaeon]MCX8198796.1 exosome complex protein Rrp42 [Sulfolobales archaeon]MDW8169869.1 exosome complex protein Rrp42 [Desulfurococcaceae archaeon]